MPVRTLNTVVLPAPLGPMMLKISPSWTTKSTSSTARRPPNSMVSPLTSSRAMASTSRGRRRHLARSRAGLGHRAGPAAGKPNLKPALFGTGAQQPVGPEDHDDDEQRPVKHQAALGDGRGHSAEQLGQ